MKPLLAALATCLALLAPARAAEPAATPVKTLRYALKVAETGLDPAHVSDIYSRTLTSHIFEGLYTYDPLARPTRIVPLIAAGEPETSADFRTFTIQVRPGIYFADDPAFKGRRREVTAADFVYSIKRFADPANNSPAWPSYEEMGIVGLNELREKVDRSGKPFPYDAEVEGLKATGRYTLQVRTREARPRLIESVFAGNDLYGAVAREVVEFYGDKISEHPVGTGPFMLKAWRRSSQLVFERNPGYRERRYEASPAPGDAEAQAIYTRFKGRRIPMVDRVVVDIIVENQPRWLAFLNNEHDFIERVPEDFITQAAPARRLAPNLARRGMHAVFTLAPDSTLTCFNLDDPVVGGMAPARVALRRAISLAYDTTREIQLARRGQAEPAQSPLMPGTSGFDASFKSEMGDYDPARARALLDMYGYVDRDGDGWRDLPDGSPLVITRNTEANSLSRAIDELWDKSLRAVGIKLQLKVQQWPENLKAAQSGHYQMWPVVFSAAQPDGIGALQFYYGPAIGTQNLARFKDARFDALYDRMQALPDGPEREALFREAKRMTVAYMPYKVHAHRVITDIEQPWMSGFYRPLFWQDFWQFVDIDAARQPVR
ncbi:ABC transporter substrate-binding protein [Roseateles saccharophilus]|uniref:ABC-type transport system substrate-binding protein n=1 Tax=Roseateles saccharophilus TaxID=304 RepID=A0A4R3UKR0_ROSSA|nr:ABC transporter substrate-binding protein [Roseateles saccharophilus]MDG0833997.1 bicyclomycin resistance protein [Roseateles saccharophilus]TCU90933.1 ABC-type transport system substrate-binding protein [Roseateles saccharophilus]